MRTSFTSTGNSLLRRITQRYFDFEDSWLLQRGLTVDQNPQKTDVLITIDTEFSAGGCFDFPGKHPITDQAVFCNIDGQSHGLRYLLDTFSKYASSNSSIKATFFVEAAHVLMLGMDVMRPAVDAILEAGHDIQLHIHPMWRAGACAKHSSFEADPFLKIDSMAALDEGQCKNLIETGLNAFHAWGAPTPCAFRAGNLHMGLAAYRALKSFNIPLSSSIGTGMYIPSDRKLQVENGRHLIEGVLEIPVLTYSDSMRNKCATITGTGTWELFEIMETARSNKMDDIAILTHPFEYIKRNGESFDQLAPNPVNKRRLEILCARLADPLSGFRASTFAEKKETWLEKGPQPSQPVRSPLLPSIVRIVGNQINDRLNI